MINKLIIVILLLAVVGCRNEREDGIWCTRINPPSNINDDRNLAGKWRVQSGMDGTSIQISTDGNKCHITIINGQDLLGITRIDTVGVNINGHILMGNSFHDMHGREINGLWAVDLFGDTYLVPDDVYWMINGLPVDHALSTNKVTLMQIIEELKLYKPVAH